MLAELITWRQGRLSWTKRTRQNMSTLHLYGWTNIYLLLALIVVLLIQVFSDW